jgi:hypothetical protein
MSYEPKINTWPKLFERLGVEWCQGCDSRFTHESGELETGWSSLFNEATGLPTIVGERFHWKNRRMTRPSTHKAIKQITEGRHPELRFLPPWRGLFLLHVFAREAATVAGRRFPRASDDLDRARLRFLLSEYRIEDRRHMTPSEQADFKEARRWAQRS